MQTWLTWNRGAPNGPFFAKNSPFWGDFELSKIPLNIKADSFLTALRSILCCAAFGVSMIYAPKTMT
jgi:hypothetical protein